MWLAALVALVAASAAGLMMFLTAAGYSKQQPWGLLVAGLTGVAFTSTVAGRYTTARRKVSAAYNPESGSGDVLPESMAGNSDIQKMADGSDEVRRVLIIAASVSDQLLPVLSEFDFDDDHHLVSYAFRSLQPGLFAGNSMQDRFHGKMTESMGQGWSIDFDAVSDTASGTKKSDVPTRALPEMWPVVRSREEAARNFDNIAITVGLGASGPIAFPPKLFPHRELTGSTGGGKSVSARAEIMQYLAFGYRIFAVDGKNTDYASFFRVPNFSAISTTLHEHIIVIHMVAQILQSRRRTASASAKQGDNSWRDELTPILLVLDEWASVRSQMKSMLKPKEMQLIDNDLVNILKVGREFRVNVLLATQDMKADTVPSDWQDMFIAVASAGKPAPMTVRKAFPEEIQGKVTRIGGTISRKTPGRSLISVVDEETGAANAELYQAFWSYSPAETINEKLPAEVRGNWTQFKDCVVDQIPQLYPRQWVKLEYPQYTEKDPYKELRENEEVWVDITKMSVEDLHKLRPVALENRNNGFEYIEENAKYDPLSELYLGQEPLDGENGSLTDVID